MKIMRVILVVLHCRKEVRHGCCLRDNYDYEIPEQDAIICVTVKMILMIMKELQF